jgi:ribonucleoside-diphosphate reductase alpha chain
MMVERVVSALATVEQGFDGVDGAESFAMQLTAAVDNKDVILSTPVLTNAGRFSEKPLTACTVPSLEVREANKEVLRKEIGILHEQGMGTGFNLGDVENPASILRFLNDVALEGVASGREDRPVGNMAVLSVYHPGILEFIEAKHQTGDYSWKFNISVDVDDAFMQALANDDVITLQNGRTILASEVFGRICEAATDCADPGLVFLDRMNARNPLPGLGEFKTTAPCAEVGLIEGETCQFGYVNVANFVKSSTNGLAIDYDGLRGTTRLMARALDDALEISIANLPTSRSRMVAAHKRKIGIGICGVADALSIAGVAYDTEAGRNVIRDMLACINYESKEESIRMAESRGSCLAMSGMVLPNQNRHMTEVPLIESLYADKANGYVSADAWQSIAQHIRRTRSLRNITTVALPPTGRSALIIDASTGVEPHFAFPVTNPRVQELYEGARQSRPEAHSSDAFKTARAISPLGHLAMASTLQFFTDEAISKTINLPAGSGSDLTRKIYLKAHETGMSGITVYVDGSSKLQPKPLSK